VKDEWRRAGRATGELRCRMTLPAIEFVFERFASGPRAVTQLGHFLRSRMPEAQSAVPTENLIGILRSWHPWRKPSGLRDSSSDRAFDGREGSGGGRPNGADATQAEHGESLERACCRWAATETQLGWRRAGVAECYAARRS
jgi:hypothetical protein